MHILVALTAFKGSLSALEACRAAAVGARRANSKAKITIMPVSDGGDGLLDTIAYSHQSGRIQLCKIKVAGPLGAPTQAHYLLWKSKKGMAAVIEMARASGLSLIPENKRNPLLATTFGLGEMIRHALRHRVKHIYIGLGGSATADAGCAMAQALGAKLLDRFGRPIGMGSAWLGSLDRMDLTMLRRRVKKAKVIGLADVRNRLLGPQGAARVFAPQKGATPVQVEIIEAALAHFAQVVRKDLGMDVSLITGGGAAGGLGAGLAAFFKAKILPGTDTILDLMDAKTKIRDADIVMVGEGRLDATTLSGKAPFGVARLAKKMGKKTVGIFGSIESRSKGLPAKLGLKTYRSLVEVGGSQEKALKQAPKLMQMTAQKLIQKLI